MILETAVKTRILAQHLDLPSTIKNCLITNKVTSKFFITLVKPICYTKNSRLTTVSRIMGNLNINQGHSMSKQLSINNREYQQQLVSELLKQAKAKGASQAQVVMHSNQGLDINVRNKDVETIEHVKDKAIGITVYYGQRKGKATTTDITPAALQQTVEKACKIADYTQDDDYAGLADAAVMAYDYPQLDLYYPWHIAPEEAIQLALDCEAQAMAQDKRITNSEGANISSTESVIVYGNSHGFIGDYQYSRASMTCSLIASLQGNMQRGYDYTLAVDANDLINVSELAKSTAKRTVERLGARPVKSCKVPVLFSTDVAYGLFNHFAKAVSGSSQYRRSSFLLESLDEPVFAPHITIKEDPFMAKAIASSPFDFEGVKVTPRTVVEAGVLRGYFLNSYSARKLGMQTTGHAGGMHNLLVSNSDKRFEELLKTMDKGLLVTEMMGQGINMVTGDYSRGAAGFWVEKGEIQYPVEEITIAGNLKDMYQQIVAIANDVDKKHAIQTGSVLIEQMSIAGK